MSNKEKVPDMVTIPQAAKRLGMNSQKLRRILRTEQFPCVHAGRYTYLDFSNLLKFFRGEVNGHED